MTEPITEQKKPITIDTLLNAVEFSPLNPDIRRSVRQIITGNRALLESMIKKAPFRAPEQDFEGEISTRIMELIGPALSDYKVPDAHGRNTFRHLYQALGGKQPVQYEPLDYSGPSWAGTGA